MPTGTTEMRYILIHSTVPLLQSFMLNSQSVSHQQAETWQHKVSLRSEGQNLEAMDQDQDQDQDQEWRGEESSRSTWNKTI